MIFSSRLAPTSCLHKRERETKIHRIYIQSQSPIAQLTHIEKKIAEVGIYKRKQENKNSTKKAIKKTRKQELDQESDQENKKKRKQTRTRPRKRPRKKEKTFFFSWSLSWSSSCFLSCFLVFLIAFLVEFLFSCFLDRFLGRFLDFLFSYFLVFFYKFPPQVYCLGNASFINPSSCPSHCRVPPTRLPRQQISGTCSHIYDNNRRQMTFTLYPFVCISWNLRPMHRIARGQQLGSHPKKFFNCISSNSKRIINKSRDDRKKIIWFKVVMFCNRKYWSSPLGGSNR